MEEKRIEGDVVEEERSNGETKGDPGVVRAVLQVPRCESLHEVGVTVTLESNGI